MSAAQPTGRDTNHAHEVTTETVARALFTWDTENHPDPAPTWDGLTEEQRDVWRSGARVAIAAGSAALLAAGRERTAAVLSEHRYLCGSDRGVSPRWEQCVCGERFTTAPGVSAWRLLAEHQAAAIARSAS